MSGDTWKEMGPDQPRICAGCGERVKLSDPEALMFVTSAPRSSWHWHCYDDRKAKLRKGARKNLRDESIWGVG